jgi:signal transduction histidine kinase
MRIFSSLRNRIFVASAALTLLCISTAIYVVNRRVTSAAEDELHRELLQAGVAVDQQRATLSDVFAIFARTVADLPKLKAAVATDDPPTVRPVAAEYARAVHADLLLVTNRSGRVLAESFERGTPPGPDRIPSLGRALEGHETTTFCTLPGLVLQVVSVPISAGAAPPEILGTLSLGFLLDQVLAERFKAQTGSDLLFATQDGIVASTLPRGQAIDLTRLPGGDGVVRVEAGDGDYLAYVRPLASKQPRSVLGTLAAPPLVRSTGNRGPMAVILRSRTERLRFLQPIRAALLVTGALAMLLAVGLSYAIARTITRPLAAITDTMREMSATGDLTRRIAWPTSRWKDEDAQVLAASFNTLTASITRFQRQFAERERLSALGRLSTVIAHEVRNPLMIIKGSLRPPRHRTSSPEEIREAAADIDEEVERLNRLVNDVLDFARPLRFDLAPTDVNAVCRQSVDAAASDEALAVPVRLVLAPSLPAIVSDGERLRSVLVNLLVNARHAVAARNDGGAGAVTETPVEIETRAVDGGVAIAVRDRGVGIEVNDLPRVFEPYFTTKRTGSGLGLAISRNIVEGLGGTIQVTSQAGLGTEVRIELRDAPPPSPTAPQDGPRP